MSRQTRLAGDRGSGVVQLPLMATVFIGFAMLLVFIGRVNNAYSAVESAARYGAREMTLARDPTAAAASAEEAARVTIDEGSSRCGSVDFSYVILPDRVAVTVTCTLDLSGLGLWGTPGEWSVTATADEPLDRWRESP